MSGIGVAVGFVGSLTALVLIGGIATDGHAQRAFLPAAALFAVFALPLFLLVRERERDAVPASARRSGRSPSSSRPCAARAARRTAG